MSLGKCLKQVTTVRIMKSRLYTHWHVMQWTWCSADCSTKPHYSNVILYRSNIATPPVVMWPTSVHYRQLAAKRQTKLFIFNVTYSIYINVIQCLNKVWWSYSNISADVVLMKVVPSHGRSQQLAFSTNKQQAPCLWSCSVFQVI